jgi:lysozyme
MNELENQLMQDEGLRLKPYKDSVGKLTIGIGRNLDDNGISKEEAIYLMQNDINAVQKSLNQFPWFTGLDLVRQDVVTNMVFNLGLPRFLCFKNMIEALRNKDYKKASEEMLASTWATQVKRRAFNLAQMMKTGEYLHDV